MVSPQSSESQLVWNSNAHGERLTKLQELLNNKHRSMFSKVLLSAYLLVSTVAVSAKLNAPEKKNHHHGRQTAIEGRAGRFEFDVSLATEQGSRACNKEERLKIKYFMWSSIDSWLQTQTGQMDSKESSVEYLECSTCGGQGQDNGNRAEKQQQQEETSNPFDHQHHRQLPNWGNYNGGGSCSCSVCNCDNSDDRALRKLARANLDLETKVARHVSEGMNVLTKYEDGDFCLKGNVEMTVLLFM